MHPTLKKNPSFELKGTLFTSTVLHLFDSDMELFTTQLRHHAQTTPNLFKNMPLVIDLQRLENTKDEIDFSTLQHHLREHGLVPVGVRHGNEKLNTLAQQAGLAILASQSNHVFSNSNKTKSSETVPANHTMLITKPVRSGQQIYAKGANLVLLAPVNHGAELLADGHIHAYCSLRGRVLAGAKGDQTARIFCPKLEAELISIAGHYQLHESFPTLNAPMVQVYLEDEKICIAGLEH